MKESLSMATKLLLDPWAAEQNSVQFRCSVVSDSLLPYGLQLTRPPCSLPTPWAYSNSCPLSQWCHPAISSSITPFTCPQSFPASRSFPINLLFLSGGQSIGASASASVLLMYIQDWFPLELTGLISLLSKGLSWFFSSTTINSSVLSLVCDPTLTWLLENWPFPVLWPLLSFSHLLTYRVQQFNSIIF